MSEKEKEELKRKEATHFIDDLIVYKVDLVKNPATGDKFLTVRGSEEEVLGAALDANEANRIKEALLSTGDINVVRLGKATEPSDSSAKEVNREEVEEQENEMATKESKLVPKEDVKREEPEIKKEATEETPVEPEETKREETPEVAPPPTAVLEETKSEPANVQVSVDMSRTEESLSKMMAGVETIAGNVDKMVERSEKTDSKITELTEKIEKLGGRIDELERSSEVTNSLPEDDGERTTEEAKRSQEKPFWAGIL